jgi:hypothetical protein
MTITSPGITPAITTSEDTVVDTGRCWSVYTNSYYRELAFAKHFATLGEAVAAVTSDVEGIAQIDCTKPACVKQRHAAIRTEQARQHDAELATAATERAVRLVDHATAEITRGDAKAGFAGTVQLAALFAVVDGKAGIHGPLQWIAGGLLVAAVIVTVLAVWPSLPSRKAGGNTSAHWLHFGVVRHLAADELAARIQTGYLEGICRQATALSRIAYSKHVRLRWSLLIALAGVVAAVLATI